MLTTGNVLAHYDPTKKLIHACDASAYDIGAVLSHQLEDGSAKPVAFASSTLTDVEKNYQKRSFSAHFWSQEISCIFVWPQFSFITDHKALLTLFSEKQAIPQQASGRIQCWALALAAYEYNIAFRSTDKHSNADALSRLRLQTQPTNVPMPVELVLLLSALSKLPVTSTQICSWTQRDPELFQVLQCIEQGWPESMGAEGLLDEKS